MRKFYLITGLFIFLTSCAVFKPEKKQFQDGWYFITESETNSQAVTHKFSDNITRINLSPILLAKEASTIEVVNDSWQNDGSQLIGMVYSGEQQRKWAEATKRMSKTNEKAVFLYKDQVICTISAFYEMDNGYVAISAKEFNPQLIKKIAEDLNSGK